MSRRFQNGSLFKEKRKGKPDVWVYRYYSDDEGKRKYRKQVIGTVPQFPLRRDVEKEVASLRIRVNSDVHVPETVSQLIAHYKVHELPRKAFASRENHEVLTRLYIEPRWGNHRLSAVRTVEVARWSRSGSGLEDKDKELLFGPVLSCDPSAVDNLQSDQQGENFIEAPEREGCPQSRGVSGSRRAALGTRPRDGHAFR
jgi:hypothetical protein